MIHNDLMQKWAMAQNHVASYCHAHDIPYYWWTTDNWYQPKFADLLYLKPKIGNEMFGNLGQIDSWLEIQGIIANGDRIHGLHDDPDQPLDMDFGPSYIDLHRGEDGHHFIGEMVGNFIKHGIEPKRNDNNKELLKENILSRPNLTHEDADGGNDYDNDMQNHYKELLEYASTDSTIKINAYRPHYFLSLIHI